MTIKSKAKRRRLKSSSLDPYRLDILALWVMGASSEELPENSIGGGACTCAIRPSCVESADGAHYERVAQARWRNV